MAKGMIAAVPEPTLDATSDAVSAATPSGAGPVAQDLLERLCRNPRRATSILHVHVRAASAGVSADWPVWADPAVVESLTAQGITALWRHQREVADFAWSGRHVIIGTGTASGKTLAYQLPALHALNGDPRARVLYVAPTKALAADQFRSLDTLALPALRAARYDGDTDIEERRWARAHANFVLTNPDMLHRGLLPQHARFRSFLAGLRYIVIDECHTYRGMFGSHVAQVLRRLRRLCSHYGSTPTFILASATTADPAGFGTCLTGLPVVAVTQDASPRGRLTVALCEPPLVAGDPPARRSAIAETSDLLADLVVEGARTLAFVRSRRGAEIVAAGARRALASAAPSLTERVGSYRAGYLSEDRRVLEADLQSGRLLGVASTNALELGIDVTGLDAVVIAGWPGTVASLWQQAGRAGRGDRDATAIFVARDDPLDTYLVHHPDALFGRPIEATVLDPTNPYVLGPHLEHAAAELPLTPTDFPLFEGSEPVIEALVQDNRLRQRSGGWFWARHGERPDADLRSSAGGSISLVEQRTGRLLGHVDRDSADSSVYAGAVYLHLGVSYVVQSLDLGSGVALLEEDEPDWTTTARSMTDLSIVETLRGTLPKVPTGPSVGFATVDVATQVVSYLRRRLVSGEVVDEMPLSFPPRALRTRAVFVTLPDPLLERASLDRGSVPGAAHATEHAAIGLLPLFATCDRWDIGGVSTAHHPDTGAATIFVYDGHAGGAGFAERGYGLIGPWLAATRDAISACECTHGCPSCVQSPKCGNGNEPLDKAGAIRLLDQVTDRLAEL